MNKNNLLTVVILLILFLVQNSYAQQSVVKSWEGSLDVGMGGKLKVILHITQTGDGKLAATMDSPDQNAMGIKVDSVIIHENNIKITSSIVGGMFIGKVNQDFTQIDGEWKQAGKTFPLTLKPLSLTYLSFWQGVLNAGGSKLKMIVKFFNAGNDSLGAFLDSPDQGVKDIPASKVIYGDDSVYFAVKVVNGFYSGKLSSAKSKIEGKWNQGGTSFPLLLEKIDKVDEVKRPQVPQKPYQYNEEEVTFENKEAGITLAGTFTYPKEGKNFPAVILVTGSGPQNRDEEVFGHKPFLIWSDYLTRNGIAVLRYDDRGVGKSTGKNYGCTSVDFTADAIAAVNYLKGRKEVNKKKIGIAGHSEGGVIAPIAANKCHDISFIVLGAGTAVPGDEILLLQISAISKMEGTPEYKIKQEYELNKKNFEIIKSSKDSLECVEKINRLYDDYYNSLPDSEKSKPENSSAVIEQRKKGFMSTWMRYFLKYDPRTELVKLQIPVLALFGGKDIQVAPSQNKDEMEKALKKSKSKNYKVIVLPGMNHIFQECETGSISEYAKIEQTTSPKMLTVMTEWIKEVTK